MSEQKNDIEIFDSEDEIIIEPLNNKSLYDIKGNLITADDARNTLPENTDLIQKAMNGDKKAFETLYMQSYRYVFFVARQYIPDDETTYDVIQETFIKVYKNISALREPKAYYGWITVIAKNTARDFMRTTRSESSFSEKEEDYSAFLSDDETQKEVTLDIEAVLRKLDPQDAELLSLVYYDGMRVNAIAKMRGEPATTVYSRLNRAKRNLKAQLNAHGIDKAIYSGNFISMITVAIRNIIGTALLSFAIAQQILDSIINGKDKKELAVAKIIRSQQKKAILKIASVIVAISVITSLFTFLMLDNLDKTGDFTTLDKSDDTVDTASDIQNTVDATDSDSQEVDNSIVIPIENSSKDKSNSSKSDNNSPSKNTSVFVNSSNTETVSSSDNSGNSSVSSSENESNDNNIIPEETVLKVFGTSANNVMKFYTDDFSPIGAPVVKQGENVYYSDGTNIYSVKTDGSQKRVIYTSEADYPMVTDLNLVGEHIYFIDNGIKSIKTDGSDFKLIYDGAAYNLLVRGNTAWYADIDGVANGTAMYVSYVLYQLDLKTGESSVLVENGKGFGLKAIIDDTLVYVSGDTLYAKSLSDGSEKSLYKIKYTADTYYYGIENMCINGDEIYILEEKRDNTSKNTTIVKLNINEPQDVQKYTDIKGNNIFALYGYIPDYGLFASYQDSSGALNP